MSNNALAIYGEFDNLQRASLALYKSGFFNDTKSEAQAIVKVMAGAELGIPPFAAMTGINIIQGKPAIGSNIIATLVKNDPRYDYRVVGCDNTGAVLVWFEDGKEVGESTFTMDEAKTAGLAHKDNWKKWPSDMLFARALTRGARRFAPGIFGGAPVYTPDELGADTDQDGNIVEGEVTNSPGVDWSQVPEVISPEEIGLESPKPTAKMTKKFHALGAELYGDEWDDRRPELVTAVTSKRYPKPAEIIKSSNDLFHVEMQRLIDGMQSKIDERTDEEN